MRLLELATQCFDGMIFDPTGQRLCLTSTQGRVAVLDLLADTPELNWLEVSGSRFHMACFDPSGTQLMCAAGHGGLVVLDLADKPARRVFHDEMYGLSCCSRGDGLVMGSTSDNTGSRLRVWQWSEFDEPLHDYEQEVGRWYANPLFLPDRDHYVAVERRDQVDDTTTTRDWFALREVKNNLLLADVKIGQYVSGPPVWCEATQTLFAPQHNKILGWKPFEPEQAVTSSRLMSSRNRINWLASHSFRPRLLAANSQQQIKVLDTQMLSVARQVRWRVGQIRAVALSADGLLAAAFSQTGKLIIWDFEE